MIKLLLSLVLLISLFLSSTVYAQEVKVTPQKVYPDSPLYQAKRLLENLYEKTLPSRSKQNFYSQLIDTRFSELYQMADQKNLDKIQKSSERFSFAVGRFSDSISSQSDIIKQQSKERFQSYKPFLSDLRDKYEANSAYWLLLQQNIDTIDILSNKLSP